MRRREVLFGLGAATLACHAAQGQQDLPVIGFMSGRSAAESAHLVAAFLRGLREAGFVEGRSVLIEFRWAEGEYDRLPGLAAELVRRPVSLLVAAGGDGSALAAKRATATIPVIFGMGGDPVEAGLVESINRPGGNVTGWTFWTAQTESKRLGFLRELMPGVALIGVLLNPLFPPFPQQLREIETAAGEVGQRVALAEASNDAELGASLEALRQRGVSALLIASDPFFDTRRDRIIAFAAESRLPAIYQFREYAVSGGLISYGPRSTGGYYEGGVYAGRILKGTKPSELPVIQPTRFELVINLKTVAALGFVLPNSIQLLADEVIE
jgi:putative ABC transport system substrate-binding protein